MEPISTVIASAIALGAAAGLKPTVERAILYDYEGLKRVITDRYQGKEEVVDAIEYVTKKPDAKKRREVLEEALSDAGATEDVTLIEAASAVHTAVERYDPDLSQGIGMEIGQLKAAMLEVENVQATRGGIGVKIDSLEIEGKAAFKNIGGGSDPNR